MPYSIDRLSLRAGPFGLTHLPATSAKMSIASYAGSFVFVESVTAATTILWYVARSLDDASPLPARASDGTAITTPIVATAAAYAVPDALFGAQFIVPVLALVDAVASVNICLKG